MSAQVSSINASTNAYAIGGGLFGDSNAEANTNIGNSTVEAHLAGSGRDEYPDHRHPGSGRDGLSE